jgi:hypothetical protein
MSVAYSILFSATLQQAEECEVGDLLIPDAADDDAYVVATIAERGSRRCHGIALTAWGGTGAGAVQLQQTGHVSAAVTGLAAGSASWVRCSALGRLERFTPASGGTSDVVGYADALGGVALMFGVLTESMVAGGSVGWTNVGDYGATGDGTTDDLAAIEAAIAAAGDGAVYLPPGIYRLSANLRIQRTVRFKGVGGIATDEDGALASTSILQFDEGFGLIVDNNATSVLAGSTGNGMGSTFDDLCIAQDNPGDGSTAGVTLYARTVWRNCTVTGFGGDGFSIPTDGGSLVTESIFDNCYVINCAKPWHILTGNSLVSGGMAKNCRDTLLCANVFGCLFLGLKFRGCNASGIAFQLSGPVGDEDGHGQHIAVGCSVSGGNGSIAIRASSQWLGGNTGGGFHSSTNGLKLEYDYRVSPLIAVNAKGAVTVSSGLGHDSTTQQAFWWQSSDDADEYKLRYDETASAQRWQLMHNATIVEEVTATGHTEGKGRRMFPNGFLLGSGGDRRIQTIGSAAPSGASPRASGNWEAGDVVWNSAPTAGDGSVAFWQCTTAGNPGTWTARP